MTTEQPPAAPRPPRGLVLAVAAVLAVLLGVVATVLLWPEHHPAALPPPAASPTPTTPSATPTPTPTPTPTKVLPYPFFATGTCFDHPRASRSLAKVEARPCEGDHDGESIANVTLPEGLTSDSQISTALRDGCRTVYAETAKRQSGGPYESYPIGPDLGSYQQGNRDTTCTLMISNKPGAAKLTGHLR
ncbi:hypothetical protein [Kitasatospora sp. NPDC050543]|uniref:hypothetical protein n=1 Tax=Kitasatospora sp. NPDC050543 TaxID=3364054 RepID=UPI0037B8ACA3